MGEIVLAALLQGFRRLAESTEKEEGRLPLSLNEIRHELEGKENFRNFSANGTGLRVDLSGRTHRHGNAQLLTLQRIALRTIGPAIGEHVILPLLEEGGRAVPIHRELQDDVVIGFQQLLFGGDVNLAVRIELVDFVNESAVR